MNMITWIHRFTTTDPATFRTGDIVEVQTTISVVPVKKDQFRMIINMRALAMLDNGPSIVSILHHCRCWRHLTSYATESWPLSIQGCHHPSAIKAPLKRKVGYAELDDQVVEAKRKMNNMAMNEREWTWLE
jgi:hypothetical protein